MNKSPQSVIEADASQISAEYLANALMRAVMLLEGAAEQNVGYHNHWLRVDAECLRIVAQHAQLYHAKATFFDLAS